MDFQTMNLLFRCGKEFSHSKIKGTNLSDTEYMICSYLCSHPNCSQDEAAYALKTDKTTVAKAVTALESKGCIEREQDKTDKRIKRLRVTQTGRDKVYSLIDIHNEWLSEILSCLSAEEQAQFESFCERLLTAAEAFADRHKNGGNPNAR